MPAHNLLLHVDSVPYSHLVVSVDSHLVVSVDSRHAPVRKHRHRHRHQRQLRQSNSRPASLLSSTMLLTMSTRSRSVWACLTISSAIFLSALQIYLQFMNAFDIVFTPQEYYLVFEYFLQISWSITRTGCTVWIRTGGAPGLRGKSKEAIDVHRMNPELKLRPGALPPVLLQLVSHLTCP